MGSSVSMTKKNKTKTDNYGISNGDSHRNKKKYPSVIIDILLETRDVNKTSFCQS